MGTPVKYIFFTCEIDDLHCKENYTNTWAVLAASKVHQAECTGRKVRYARKIEITLARASANCYLREMKNTTKNAAPIGSMWMGRDSNDFAITVTVESDTIPGNELRHVKVTSRNYAPIAYADVIGAKWFKRATRVA